MLRHGNEFGRGKESPGRVHPAGKGFKAGDGAVGDGVDGLVEGDELSLLQPGVHFGAQAEDVYRLGNRVFIVAVLVGGETQAGPLGLLQGLVGAVDHIRRGGAPGNVRNGADAHTGEYGVAPHGAGNSHGLVDTVHEFFGLLPEPRRSRQRGQDGKFVPARAVEPGVLPYGLLEPSADDKQDPVPVDVPNLLVDELEPVEVERGGTENLPGTFPALQGPVQVLDEGGAVREAGEVVKIGLPGEALFESLSLGEVPGEEKNEMALSVPDLLPPDLHGKSSPVGPGNIRLEHIPAAEYEFRPGILSVVL